MSDLCGHFTGSRVDLHTGEIAAGAIWCKSWHCEYCAPIRQKQLMAQAAQGNPTKFITLTSKYRPDELSPSEAAAELVHAWRMTIQRGKREKVFDNIQYIAVFEQTKKGWPHLHILARCSFLAQEWLSNRMQQYADSPIVDVRKVKSRKRAAWYIAKYTAKAPEKFEGCKRYWRTHGYSLEPQDNTKPVHDASVGFFYHDDVDTIAGFYQANGYQVDWTSEHSFIAAPSYLDVFAHLREKRRRETLTPYKESSQWNSGLKTNQYH